VTQPGPVEEVTNAPARRPSGLVRGHDRPLEPFSERLEPVLTLYVLNSGLAESVKALWYRHAAPP